MNNSLTTSITTLNKKLKWHNLYNLSLNISIYVELSNKYHVLIIHFIAWKGTQIVIYYKQIHHFLLHYEFESDKYGFHRCVVLFVPVQVKPSKNRIQIFVCGSAVDNLHVGLKTKNTKQQFVSFTSTGRTTWQKKQFHKLKAR